MQLLIEIMRNVIVNDVRPCIIGKIKEWMNENLRYAT